MAEINHKRMHLAGGGVALAGLPASPAAAQEPRYSPTIQARAWTSPKWINPQQ